MHVIGRCKVNKIKNNALSFSHEDQGYKKWTDMPVSCKTKQLIYYKTVIFNGYWLTSAGVSSDMNVLILLRTFPITVCKNDSF